jgi:hypothetical protein
MNPGVQEDAAAGAGARQPHPGFPVVRAEELARAQAGWWPAGPGRSLSPSTNCARRGIAAICAPAGRVLAPGGPAVHGREKDRRSIPGSTPSRTRVSSGKKASPLRAAVADHVAPGAPPSRVTSSRSRSGHTGVASRRWICLMAPSAVSCSRAASTRGRRGRVPLAPRARTAVNSRRAAAGPRAAMRFFWVMAILNDLCGPGIPGASVRRGSARPRGGGPGPGLTVPSGRAANVVGHESGHRCDVEGVPARI